MPLDRDAFYQLYEVERLSLAECGRRLGCSYRTAWKWAQRYGFDTQSRLGIGRRGKSKGRVSIRGGYVLVYAPDHPNAKQGRYMYEHRLVMEQHLGRYLTSEEVVHHINGDTSDNRIENLQLFASNGEHLKATLGQRWARKFDRCQSCGTTKRRHEARGLCSMCHQRRQREQRG